MAVPARSRQSRGVARKGASNWALTGNASAREYSGQSQTNSASGRARELASLWSSSNAKPWTNAQPSIQLLSMGGGLHDVPV